MFRPATSIGNREWKLTPLALLLGNRGGELFFFNPLLAKALGALKIGTAALSDSPRPYPPRMLDPPVRARFLFV
ncbi:MAG: hypothetical protein D6715_11915 [Calditrichaeota bacterium]|nr:MAG: hypothetical protein D6715_11915 [Calditrichota bacterium]